MTERDETHQAAEANGEREPPQPPPPPERPPPFDTDEVEEGDIGPDHNV